MRIPLGSPDGLRIICGIADPVATGGDWQSTQLQLIQSLLPHVRQPVLVRQALVGADALSASLAGLLDNSRIGVLHLDRGGRVLAVNGHRNLNEPKQILDRNILGSGIGHRQTRASPDECARSRRQGRQPREAGAERSEAP